MGKSKKTIQGFASHLKYINHNAEINDPENVKAYISSLNLGLQTKNSYALAYDWYCKTSNTQWKKPYFNWERKIPMIPTTANMNKIISASSQKYATIFTILKEQGLEGHELANVHRNDIDQERGIINVRGCKSHNSRSIKLNAKTANMLRIYLERYKDEHPFPNLHAMGEEWRSTRRKIARNLNQPELETLLRNNSI